MKTKFKAGRTDASSQTGSVLDEIPTETMFEGLITI